MHVGKSDEHCPKLTIDSWKVKNVRSIKTSQYEICDEVGDTVEIKDSEHERYLGDEILATGRNDVNIAKRKEKGYKIINQIKTLLQNGFYGRYYFKVAVLLRSSLFLNSVLLNSEAWNNVSKKDVHELTIIDNAMVRSIWGCPAYTSVPMMFLELGIIPLKVILMQRRMMYLHYILQQKEESLLAQCFQAQVKEQLKGDHIMQIQDDLKSLNIQLTFTQIKQMTKEAFSKMLKEKIKAYAFKILMYEKSCQRKCGNVEYENLEIQEYLSHDSLTMQQKKLLFQLRSSSCPVFMNITFLVGERLCPCCFQDYDTCGHQLLCKVINANTNMIAKGLISIEDIFSKDVDKQAQVTIMFEQSWKRRKILLKHIKESSVFNIDNNYQPL